MDEAGIWDESRIRSLITNQVQESLTLEYKQSKALLGKTEVQKKELSKDVSAFANSSGGTIIYGIIEDKHFPLDTDNGFDAAEVTKEWLEQVLNSVIQPRIEGLIIHQVALLSRGSGIFLYVITIPAATARAPHQAHDKRYYKRYNFSSAPMDDYEIRDISRRASTPDLSIKFTMQSEKIQLQFRPDANISDPVTLDLMIENSSTEPALYAIIQIFVDKNLEFKETADFVSAGLVSVDGHLARTYLKKLAIPYNLPIFFESPQNLLHFPFQFVLREHDMSIVEFVIGYDVRAPGFSGRKFFKIIQEPQGTLSIKGSSGSF